MAENLAVQSSMETVNAAAAAIVSAESRVQPVTVPRRRWATWFNTYWCFGSHKCSKRVGHAVLIPEPAQLAPNPPPPENLNHNVPVRLPFIAPPSTPISIINSGPPSATLSPSGPLSLSTLSASSYSPSGPASIFAIGPYADETQLVSPPVFSTFTTEPSTAPFTPPLESVKFTAPSPEVLFARLLTSTLEANCKQKETYEFQSYQLYSGSPIGHLISPSSVCSGTSSPFPDIELHSSSGGSLLSFPTGEQTKILSSEGIAVCKLLPRHARNGGSLLDGQISAAAPFTDLVIENHTKDQRVSFELTAEDVTRCLEKKVGIPCEVATTTDETLPIDMSNSNNGMGVDEFTHQELLDQFHASSVVPSAKEFKFNNSDGTPEEATVGSDWWANEKVVGTTTEGQKSWAFFPMIQSGVS